MNSKAAIGKASLLLVLGLFAQAASAEMMPKVQSFAQRDRMGQRGGMNLYVYLQANPLTRSDPLGDIACGPGNCWDYVNLLHPGRQCCRQTGSCLFNKCPASHHWCEWNSDGCHRPNTEPAQQCDCGEAGAVHHNAGDTVDDHTDSTGCAFGTGLLGECLWDPVCVFCHLWTDVFHLP